VSVYFDTPFGMVVIIGPLVMHESMLYFGLPPASLGHLPLQVQDVMVGLQVYNLFLKLENEGHLDSKWMLLESLEPRREQDVQVMCDACDLMCT